VELFAPLKPLDQWPAGMTKDKLTEELQKEFTAELPGVAFNFSQYIQDNVEESISGVKGANSVKIMGPDLDVIEKIAEQVKDQMSKVRGHGPGIFHVLGQPNLNIKVDREKAARYGLNTGDVNTVIQSALGGATATTVLEGDRQFGLTVRVGSQDRDSIEKVSDIKVGYQTPGGGVAYIPLRELATITLDTGASYIYHETTKRFIPVKFSVRDRDLGGAVAEAQERIAKNVKLPTGYRMVWAGEFDNMKLAEQRLAVVVPISMLLILLLLYGLFNSWRDSLLALAGSLRGGRRHHRPCSQRSLHEHFGGDRFHLLVRRGGHERHSHDHLFQSGPARGNGSLCCNVSCRNAADAADADDRLFRLYRSGSGGAVAWYRQSGSVRWRW
jgi:cobalt-zinc-cadmium resistance protein CzcA